MNLSWFSIFRLGLVQLAIGAVVVLITSTLNRLMVVELALPALLPGLLVGLHYGIQISRPNWGFLSDTGGNRTRFIVLGMAVLAFGGVLAAVAVTIFARSFAAGLGLSVLAYALIGLGVGASGTSLLALLATATHPRRRAAAATITWLMMIFGIALTATLVGAALSPYAPGLLVRVVGIVCAGALALTLLAVAGIEARLAPAPAPSARPLRFRAGLAEVWQEARARDFTVFIFLSMVAYFMQELILEPFAGLVFGWSVGQTTSLSGAQNGGVFCGMLLVGVAATGFRLGSLRVWVVAGCLGSALALAAVTLAGLLHAGAALLPAVVLLGLFNGMFAVAAIGSMMALAGEGRGAREGTRMGLWGASQAMAAGVGGLLGAGMVDLGRLMLPPATAFGAVFMVEAGLFVAAAAMAARTLGGAGAGSVVAMTAGE